MIILNNKYQIINNKPRRGSAIILAIVLTVLLAIVGVLFLFSSRVDSVATSAIGENEDLKLAADSVAAQISQVLAIDVASGAIDPNQYYDYPDPCNSWLACLEPNQSGTYWQQVSNIYGPPAFENIQAQILDDYNNTFIPYTEADADGDGVSDSIWVPVQNINTGKDKTIYAAIRIIDNGGMLNINTGFKFDPCTSVGTKQTDINLMSLAKRPFDACSPAEMQAREDELVNYRCGSEPIDINLYANNVVWRYVLPNGAYTPFDISDELELRYRYLINQTSIDTRAEVLNKWSIGRKYDFKQPIDTTRFNEWKITASADGIFTDPRQYAYRHIATTLNMDRVIAPDGYKMENINRLAEIKDINVVRNAIRNALDPIAYPDVNYLAVNLIDYLDADSNVTYYVDSSTTPPHTYFGFETPCIYISEIAQSFYKPDPCDPCTVRSYAIELFKPYPQDNDLNGWDINTTDDATGLTTTTHIVWTGTRRFHILKNINSPANITIDFNEPNEPNATPQPADINFGQNTTITLWRDVNGYGRILVDSLTVPPVEASPGWLDQNAATPIAQSYERDIASIHKCIRKILSPSATIQPTIGYMNRFIGGGDMIQAHPANKPFTNIGEIGQLFHTDVYGLSTGPGTTEASIRFNIADSNAQNIFKYMTVIDPYPLHTGDSNETRIKGRININTAPWFVLAQLPWISNHTSDYELARSIVAYRDKTVGPGGFDYASRLGFNGFRNIGELLNVRIDPVDMNRMDYYIGKGSSIPVPLVTPPDAAEDVFEERDVIFDRISNLVTIRSDVFTAYILVRIGSNGPQKRFIAILDRSDVVPNPAYNPPSNPVPYTGKVKILALQPVPDPR
jgi:hypothetical protein